VEKARKEMIYNREEWKKLLRTTWKRYILYMPMEGMNEGNQCQCDNVQNCINYLVPEISYSQQECAA